MPAPIGDWPRTAWNVASCALSVSVVTSAGSGSAPSRGGGARDDIGPNSAVSSRCASDVVKIHQILRPAQDDGKVRQAGVGGKKLLPRYPPPVAAIEAERRRPGVGPHQRRAARLRGRD